MNVLTSRAASFFTRTGRAAAGRLPRALTLFDDGEPRFWRFESRKLRRRGGENHPFMAGGDSDGNRLRPFGVAGLAQMGGSAD